MSIRASSLPLRFKCSQAGRPDGSLVPVRTETSQAAHIGNAVHEVLAELVLGRSTDVSAAAAAHGVESREVAQLVANGARAWDALKPDPGVEAWAERELEAGALTGHLDVGWLDGDTVHVYDWKTGRRDSDYSAQLRAYGAMLLVAHPEAARAVCGVVFLRDMETETYTLDRDQAAAFLDQVQALVDGPPGDYTVGDHCGFCDRRFACPAKLQAEQRAMQVIAPAFPLTISEQIRDLDDGRLVELHHQARSIRELLRMVDSEVRKIVAERGGVTGAGVTLDIEEKQTREIDTAKAWPVLQASLSDDQLARAVKVQLGKVQDAITEGAPRGQGAAKRRALMSALEDAGAISLRTSTELRERRAAK